MNVRGNPKHWPGEMEMQGQSVVRVSTIPERLYQACNHLHLRHEESRIDGSLQRQDLKKYDSHRRRSQQQSHLDTHAQ